MSFKGVVFLLSLSVVLSSCASVAWTAGTEAQRNLENMGYSIRYSEKFGSWRDAGDAGVYRLIILHTEGSHSHSLAFLQWLKTEPTSKTPDFVFATVPIKEINYTGSFKLNAPKVAGVKGALGGIAEITGVNGLTLSPQTIRIQPVNVGQYSLTFLNGPTERYTSIAQQLEDAVSKLPAK